jgi:hypothetical protein
LGLNREFLLKGLDEKLVKAYHQFQVEMAVFYGANESDAKKEMREVLDFEMRLANVSGY